MTRIKISLSLKHVKYNVENCLNCETDKNGLLKLRIEEFQRCGLMERQILPYYQWLTPSAENYIHLQLITFKYSLSNYKKNCFNYMY